MPVDGFVTPGAGPKPRNLMSLWELEPTKAQAQRILGAYHLALDVGEEPWWARLYAVWATDWISFWNSNNERKLRKLYKEARAKPEHVGRDRYGVIDRIVPQFDDIQHYPYWWLTIIKAHWGYISRCTAYHQIWEDCFWQHMNLLPAEAYAAVEREYYNDNNH